MFYRKENSCKGNTEGKQKEIKDTMLATRRSHRICDSTNTIGQNNSCDDVQPGITHSDVQPGKTHSDVQPGIMHSDLHLDKVHGDAQLDIAHGDAQHHEDLLTKSLKEMIEKHGSQGTESIQNIFARLKDVFEDKSTKKGGDIPTHETLDVEKEDEFQVVESNEEILLASNVPVTSFDGSNRSTKNIGSGLNM